MYVVFSPAAEVQDNVATGGPQSVGHDPESVEALLRRAHATPMETVVVLEEVNSPRGEAFGIIFFVVKGAL